MSGHCQHQKEWHKSGHALWFCAELWSKCKGCKWRACAATGGEKCWQTYCSTCTTGQQLQLIVDQRTPQQQFHPLKAWRTLVTDKDCIPSPLLLQPIPMPLHQFPSTPVDQSSGNKENCFDYTVSSVMNWHSVCMLHFLYIVMVCS